MQWGMELWTKKMHDNTVCLYQSLKQPSLKGNRQDKVCFTFFFKYTVTAID